MTDNELLLAISNIVHSEVSDMRSDIKNLYDEQRSMRSDIKNLYDEQRSMRSEINDMRSDMNDMRSDMNDMRSDMNDMRSDMNDMHSEINDMRSDMNDMRSDMNDMHSIIQDEAQKNLSTRLLLENEVIPRLQNIESCYTTTYSRYANGIQQLDTLQKDVDVLKIVVAEHSEILKRIS